MKYFMQMNAHPDAQGANPGCEPADWMAFDEKVRAAGVYVGGESLADLTTGSRVRVDEGGKRVVTDAPLAEAREVLGGFYVIDVPDLDAALDWASQCPGARDGSVDVRPIADFG